MDAGSTPGFHGTFRAWAYSLRVFHTPNTSELNTRDLILKSKLGFFTQDLLFRRRDELCLDTLESSGFGLMPTQSLQVSGDVNDEYVRLKPEGDTKPLRHDWATPRRFFCDPNTIFLPLDNWNDRDPSLQLLVNKDGTGDRDFADFWITRLKTPCGVQHRGLVSVCTNQASVLYEAKRRGWQVKDIQQMQTQYETHLNSQFFSLLSRMWISNPTRMLACSRSSLPVLWVHVLTDEVTDSMLAFKGPCPPSFLSRDGAWGVLDGFWPHFQLMPLHRASSQRHHLAHQPSLMIVMNLSTVHPNTIQAFHESRVRMMYLLESPNRRSIDTMYNSRLIASFRPTHVYTYCTQILDLFHTLEGDAKSNIMGMHLLSVHRVPFVYRSDLDLPAHLHVLQTSLESSHQRKQKALMCLEARCGPVWSMREGLKVVNKSWIQYVKEYQIFDGRIKLFATDGLRTLLALELGPEVLDVCGPSWVKMLQDLKPSLRNHVVWPEGGTVHHRLQDVETTISRLRQYEACVIIENCNASGYVSEKLMDAWMAGCLPFYLPPDDHDLPKHSFVDLTPLLSNCPPEAFGQQVKRKLQMFGLGLENRKPSSVELERLWLTRTRACTIGRAFVKKERGPSKLVERVCVDTNISFSL